MPRPSPHETRGAPATALAIHPAHPAHRSALRGALSPPFPAVPARHSGSQQHQAVHSGPANDLSMTSPSSLQARLVTAAAPPLPPSPSPPPSARPGTSVSKIHRVAGISGGRDEPPERNCISARGGTGLNSSSLGPLTFQRLLGGKSRPSLPRRAKITC